MFLICARKMKIKHIGTSESGKKPAAEQLDNREIAINYAAGSEAMYIKNSINEIVQFIPENRLPFMIVTATSDTSSIVTPPQMEGYILMGGSFTHNEQQVPLIWVDGYWKTFRLITESANVVAVGGDFDYLYYQTSPNSQCLLLYVRI